ncbi:MAG: GH3 auxin-responsive promoter family protein [Bacteroidetes bacterium]|uniref:GH3 auxin-responsive promoter family protein n=1 Tax=Phnomibacter sp. TaxID=2836217 RepID=UPI002FDD6726|nr:GH3 auxin-responsive promoter family protein [Bacteroidota bacterium]
MKLLSPAISRLARLRQNAIQHWMDDPVGAQRDVLQHLVTDGQYTEFGKRYKLSTTFRIRDFKAAVPIHEYDDLKPYIERMMAGEDNVLWNTPVEWFAKSSGTTSDRSKFIPVSQESLDTNHFQCNKDVLWQYYFHYPESDLLTGKGLVIGGSHQIASVNENIHYGDLSAVLLQNAPVWSQWIKTPELSIALMDEWETKIEQLAQSTIVENVTSVSGVPTWTLVLFKRILAITGKSRMLDVWPNLELYLHGGVSFTPYRQQFEQLIGGPIRYLEVYNASEGFFAAQSHEDEDGMLLYLDHGIFYEFMPIEEYGKDNPQTVGLKDVEVGKNYAPVITTTGGLWRYLIGDTIQFTSTFPFRVKVSGRLKHFINAFGEEVIIENTDQAIAAACAATGAVVTDYTAAPLYFSADSNGAHEWAVEFAQSPADTEQFANVLDDALRHINSDYDAKRHKNIALRRLVLHAVPAGTFAAWLRSKGKLGGQHKVPRLSNDRNTLEEILIIFNQHEK